MFKRLSIYMYVGQAGLLDAIVILNSVVSAPGSFREERIHVGQIVQIQARSVENVAVASLAENGTRLPQSICEPNAISDK